MSKPCGSILFILALVNAPIGSFAAQRIAGPEIDGVPVRVPAAPTRSTPVIGGRSTPIVPGVPAASAPRPTPPLPSPVAWPPPAAKSIRYDSLQLRGLSGSPSARFALINNESFRSNDTALVSVGEQRVQVRCLSIGEKSVLVQVNGEPAPRELTLLSHAPIPIAAAAKPAPTPAPSPAKRQ